MTLDKIPHFFNNIGKLFADPVLYCNFIIAVSQGAPEVPQSLTDIHLPQIVTQIIQQLTSQNPSLGLKKLMLKGLAALATKAKTIFSPHLEALYDVFLLLLKTEDYDLQKTILKYLRQIISANQNASETVDRIEELFQDLVTIVDKHKRVNILDENYQRSMNRDMTTELVSAINVPLPDSDGDWEDSDEEDEDEEDSMQIDRVPIFLFSVFDLLEYIVQELCIKEIVQIDSSRVITLFMILLESLEQEVFFEQDLDFKVIQIELVVSLLEVLKKHDDFKVLKDKLLVLFNKCMSFSPSLSESISQHIQNLNKLE